MIYINNKWKPFTTTIKELAIDLVRSVNDLLEEAIECLLKKYKKKPKKERCQNNTQNAHCIITLTAERLITRRSVL